MESVLTRDLIRLATESIDRLGAAEELPDPVVLELPDTLPLSRGRTVEWHPLVALAVAGHICRYWAQGAGPRGPFAIEAGSSPAGWATLVSPGNGSCPSRRLQAGGGPWSPSGIWITELCGHPRCTEPAPAGPGSRCPSHFGDPGPSGGTGPHWADLAARAWGERHGADGREHPRRVAERLSRLVKQAVAAGMPKEDVAAATGSRRAAVAEILRPAPDPEQGDEWM
ncbi:hypothetical protein ACIQF6_28235 [Kitasatospora sp. NPDC092948]|uniref:hypothetical protein n=1 Tax=Kitasatospora sp. NPDC092948 TaxID=3364088 RepID=UPI003801B58C